jgi:hypothetical protein
MSDADAPTHNEEPSAGAEKGGEAIVAEKGQLEALLQSTSLLRVLEMRTNDYDAAVLGRVLHARRPLSLEYFSTYRTPRQPPQKPSADTAFSVVNFVSMSNSTAIRTQHMCRR